MSDVGTLMLSCPSLPIKIYKKDFRDMFSAIIYVRLDDRIESIYVGKHDWGWVIVNDPKYNVHKLTIKLIHIFTEIP